jgi:hypothetical protein
MDTDYKILPAHNEVGSQPFYLDSRVNTWETRPLVTITKIQSNDMLALDGLDKAPSHQSSYLPTATYQKIPVLWNMMVCHWASSSQHF